MGTTQYLDLEEHADVGEVDLLEPDDDVDVANDNSFLQRKLFNVSEFHRMVEAGILDEHERVELIEGVIVRMSPIGDRHIISVNRLNKLLVTLLPELIVSVQNPLRMSDETELLPDFVLFADESPFQPSNVRLVVEVSDSSLRYDRTVKIPRYAEKEIPEVLILNLKNNSISSYSNLGSGEYKTIRTFVQGEKVQSAAIPHLSFDVNAILKQ